MYINNNNNNNNNQLQQEQNQNQPCLIVLIHHIFDTIYNKHKHYQLNNTNNNNTQQQQQQQCIIMNILFITIGYIPDVILGNCSGGTRTKISINPRSIRQIAYDLRNNDTIEFINLTKQQQNYISSSIIIQTVTQWANFLPLPPELIQLVLPHLQPTNNNNENNETILLAFFIAIYESAALEIDQILTSILGVDNNNNTAGTTSQPNKKKQTSRSKKRHKEYVDNQRTDTNQLQAIQEKQLRGDIACQITIQCWNTILYPIIHTTLSHIQYDTYVAGEGPIGVLSACANACLPHIITTLYNNNDTITTNNGQQHQQQHYEELFINITKCFQHLCMSPNKTVRGLTYEPIYTLHTTLIKQIRTYGPIPNEHIQTIIIEHLYQCCINLAMLCTYPINYFDNDLLNVESDHELEVERNDIRDIIRTITSSGEGGSTYNSNSTQYPLQITIHILAKLVHACCTADQITETIIHAFTSLAKPINHLSKCYLKSNESDSSLSLTINNNIETIFIETIHCMVKINEFTVNAFLQQHKLPMNQLLPISRIVNIGNASYAPFLTVMAIKLQQQNSNNNNNNESSILLLLQRLLDNIIHGAILSMENIPELAAPSILDHSMYDIRGTMRGPGGEDHVGTLTLMRLVYDSTTILSTTDDDTKSNSIIINAFIPYIQRLCELHQNLKRIENTRGKMIYHGYGVTPQTRRILVGTLCHLEIIGNLGASTMLTNLLYTAINDIATYHSKNNSNNQSHHLLNQDTTLFQLCEDVLDIACFAPNIVCKLFEHTNNNNAEENIRKIACLEVLTNAIVDGYVHFSKLSDHATGPLVENVLESIVQWNRLRAAVFQLFKKSVVTDLSNQAAMMIDACVKAECEAINKQCAKGPASKSYIFTDEIISPDSIPAGLFLRCIAEITRLRNQKLNQENNSSHSVSSNVLVSVMSTVHDIITLPCTEPQKGAFVDPRQTVCEAWLQAMIETCELKQKGPSVESMLVEACAQTTALIFSARVEKRQTKPITAGMDLDGPHSLSITSFFESFFKLGPTALHAVGQRLLQLIPIDYGSVNGRSGDESLLGVSIIGAALFRACSGAMPPWAVESVPDVYSSLYYAMNESKDSFVTMLHLAMTIRLSQAQNYRGLLAGFMLSGPYFEDMSDQNKQLFLTEVGDLSQKGGGASWRRVKFLIKQLCGGKKKGTDFNQKPALTRWEFERV